MKWFFIYGMLGIVVILSGTAVYLCVRIMRIFLKARRLELMRSYETILYASFMKLAPEKILETLIPEPRSPALEDVLLRMSDEVGEEGKARVMRLYRLGGFYDRRIKELRSRFKSRRSDAARRLGRIGDPGAVPALGQLLKDGKTEVREAALYALGRIGTPQSFQVMLTALDEGDRWAQEKIAEAAEEVGDESRRFLAEMMEDEDPFRRAFAAEILGVVGGAEEAVLLERALEDPHVDVRARAASSLGNMRSYRSRAALRRALDDPAWEVRCQAAAALGKLGDAEDAEVLAAAMRDATWWVRRNAALALQEMGEAGESALERVLWDEDRFAREAAVQALEESGIVERWALEVQRGGGEREERIVRRLVELGRLETVEQVIRERGEKGVRERFESMAREIPGLDMRRFESGESGG